MPLCGGPSGRLPVPRTQYCPTTEARVDQLTLRRLLLGRFAEEGIEATPDQLMLTSSGTQAIDLICRLLLRPGDTVLVDDPCYFNFQALLRAHQVRIIGVPYTPTGPDTSAFEGALIAQKPRLYLTNSALHNPTGASLSPQTAYRLLSAASAHDLTMSKTTSSRILSPHRRRALPCSTGSIVSSGLGVSPRRSRPRCAVAISRAGRTGSRGLSISRSPRALADPVRLRPN